MIQMIGAGFEIEGVIPEMRSMLVGLGQPITYHAQVDPERRPYVAELTETRDRAAARLAEQYKPHWQHAAETRMANPWSGEIRIRQEDRLRLQIGMLPRAKSNSHGFHPSYAVRRPFGWIEVATSAPARRESTALGLNYDLGLQAFQYGPLVSRYTYRTGRVSVQSMDQAAVRVVGDGLELEVSLDVPDLHLDSNGLLRP